MWQRGAIAMSGNGRLGIAPRRFGKKGDGICSIGLSDFPIQTFLERLNEHGISDFVDVRSDPHSARFPSYRV